MESHERNPGLRRELTVLDATSIVVGTIIGSAIFLLPATIAAEVGTPTLVFLIWIAGGVLTLFGALSLAELGSMYPGAGGLYVYLREAYGHMPAFLYGWGLLTIIHTGSIAALAIGFAIYFGQFFAFGMVGQKVIAASCIISLTIVNCLGIRIGKFVQNSFTVIKVGGLVGMIILLFAHGLGSGMLRSALSPHIPAMSWISAGAATVAVLWAYEGWHVISFAAGEMKQPRIDLPRSLAIGTLIIVALYLFANASYYSVLTPEEIHSSPAVASSALGKAFGSDAGRFLAGLILISVVGSMNGMVLTGPRVYYAMANDGVFFEAFGRTSARYQTPVLGLLLQGIWATALCCSGTYQQLFTHVIFTAWLFYGLAVAGVVVLRVRKPSVERRYRIPVFPVPPIVFCAASAGIAAATMAESPLRSLLGIGLICTGIPLYLLFRRPGTAHRDETGPHLAESRHIEARK